MPNSTPRDQAIHHGDLAHLLPPSWKAQITTWLAEDTPSFDYAGYVVGDVQRTATLWGKSAGIIAGVPFFTEIFAQWSKSSWKRYVSMHSFTPPFAFAVTGIIITKQSCSCLPLRLRRV